MPGLPLPSAYKVIYDPSSSGGQNGQQAATQQPRTTPIAHFASLPPAHPTGSLLDANGSYIVYAVKGGLVRVIDRRGALRTLLRGHSQRVSDVAFFGNVPGGSNADPCPPPRGAGADGGEGAGGAAPAPAPPPPGGGAADVLGTVGGEGDGANVLVWRIFRREGELASEKLLEIRFRPAARMAWHPFNPNQILLLHRAGEGGGGAAKGFAVAATLVETTRLSTVPHADGGHAVCLCGAGTGVSKDPPKVAEADGAGGDAIEGAVRLVVPGASDAAANDLCWSSVDARHVLTAHADGAVRLWDLRGRSYVDAATGAEVPAGSAGMGAGGAASNGVMVSAAIIGAVKVTDEEGGAVRCQFLPKFANASSDGSGGCGEALTPPFITGHKGNAAVMLWSGFDGTSSPVPVAVFEIASTRPLQLSLALCDAGNTLRPAELSSFILMADSGEGSLYALHIRSHAIEGGGDGKKDIASGFDFLTPFRLAHPVFSWTVGTSPANLEDDSAGMPEEGDVDANLFCVQSRAVQMLAIPPGMRLPPSMTLPPGMLADGVTIEGRPQVAEDGVATVTDEEGGGGAGKADDVEYDDYSHDEEEDMEEEDDDDDDGAHGPPASSLPPPGLSPDLKPSLAVAAAPPGVGSSEGAFANWLGAIAAGGAAAAGPPPSASPVPASERSASGAPPPPPPTPATPYKPLVPAGPPPGMPAPGMPPGILPGQPPLATAVEGSPGDDRGAGGGGSTRSGPAFLSPFEILKGAQQQNEKSAQEPSIDMDKALGALPSGPTPVPPPGSVLSKKDQTPKKDRKSTSRRGGGRNKSKSPSRNKTSGVTDKSKGVGTGAGAAKQTPPIAILKRDKPVAGGGAGAAALPSTAEAGASLTGAPPTAVGAGSAATVDLEESVRKTLASHFRKHESLLLTEVNKAVRSEVEMTVAPALDRAVADTLERTVTKPLTETISKSTKDAYNVRTREVVEGVAAEVEGPLVAAFNKAMRDVLVPAYESATRDIFFQVSSAVESGLAAQAVGRSDHDAEMMQLVNAMSSKLDTLNGTIASLTEEVTQLKAAVASGGATAAAAGAGADANQQRQTAVDRSRIVRDEILAHLHSRDYEAAFTKALSASDGEIAVFACKNANLSEVLEGSSPRLSQPILLCLMQQLGAVLAGTSSESDLRVEVAWLQDIAVTIDPNDESIRRHVGGVLRQLVANVNAKMAQGGLDPMLRRPLQMLLQVIRGMGVAS